MHRRAPLCPSRKTKFRLRKKRPNVIEGDSYSATKLAFACSGALCVVTASVFLVLRSPEASSWSTLHGVFLEVRLNRLLLAYLCFLENRSMTLLDFLLMFVESPSAAVACCCSVKFYCSCSRGVKIIYNYVQCLNFETLFCNFCVESLWTCYLGTAINLLAPRGLSVNRFVPQEIISH